MPDILIDKERTLRISKKEESLSIPKSTNYKLVGSLSNEIVEKIIKNQTTYIWRSIKNTLALPQLL